MECSKVQKLIKREDIKALDNYHDHIMKCRECMEIYESVIGTPVASRLLNSGKTQLEINSMTIGSVRESHGMKKSFSYILFPAAVAILLFIITFIYNDPCPGVLLARAEKIYTVEDFNRLADGLISAFFFNDTFNMKMNINLFNGFHFFPRFVNSVYVSGLIKFTENNNDVFEILDECENDAFSVNTYNFMNETKVNSDPFSCLEGIQFYGGAEDEG